MNSPNRFQASTTVAGLIYRLVEEGSESEPDRIAIATEGIRRLSELLAEDYFQPIRAVPVTKKTKKRASRR